MSLDQARAFIEKMKSDEAFRERILAIENVDARLDAASGAGFQFTEAEVKVVQSELSDDELDAAAGGGYKDICLPTKHYCGVLSDAIWNN